MLLENSIWSLIHC